MESGNNLLIFISLVAGGVGLEAIVSDLYFKVTKKHLRKNHFTLGKYFYLLLFPFIATIVLINQEGMSILQVFFLFSALGTIFEWLIGYSYNKIVGSRLWTYHKYSINGHTSFLSIPLWGLAGILFWLIEKSMTN